NFVEVDPVVGVNQHVTHAGHLLPWSNRIRHAKFIREPRHRFSDEEQLMNDSRLTLWIGQESIPVEALDEGDGAPRGSHHVEERELVDLPATAEVLDATAIHAEVDHFAKVARGRQAWEDDASPCGTRTRACVINPTCAPSERQGIFQAR